MWSALFFTFNITECFVQNETFSIDFYLLNWNFNEIILRSIENSTVSTCALWFQTTLYFQSSGFWSNLHIQICIQRNCVFVTNSDFLIPIFFPPNGAKLWYFKLRFFYLTEFIVWNIQGLRHWITKI